MPKRVLIPFRYEHKVLPYVEAVLAGGMEPIPRNVSERPNLNGADALLLAGGTDVNPKLYGELPLPETDAADDERDETEWRLLSEALGRDMPVLAICRGMQLLNVFYGGNLAQHLGSASIHDPEVTEKGAGVHSVRIEGNSLLHSIAGRDEWRVNSRHHQSAARVGPDLTVTAIAPDRTIEAIEDSGKRFVLGVQWHPEDQIALYPEQLRLFSRLGDSI
jgi:gamma-glutamyl-gamma-aminobutyrate hydrolase PuuD